MAASGVPVSQVLPIAGGETVDCGGGVTVTALPAQRSCLFAAPTPESRSACLGDLGVSAQERRDRTAAIFDLLPALSDPLEQFFGDAHDHNHASPVTAVSSPTC